MPSVSPQVCDQRSEANGCCGSHELSHDAPISNAVTEHSSGSPVKGKAYWRSLNDLSQTQEFREFMHREFPAGATDMLEGDDRRTFLKIMGASLALAGLGREVAGSPAKT